MDAIILAGGAIPAEMHPALSADILASAHDERALLPVAGQPAIAWMLNSLQKVQRVDRVLVIGEKNTLQLLPQLVSNASNVIGVAAKNKLSLNVLAALDVAQSASILLTTCDIPLVKVQTWNTFLDMTEARQLEAAYPIVRSTCIESTFPGGKRTYATLKDGRFTGGNAFVLPKSCRPQLENMLETVYNARKNPLKLGALLGVGFIIKAIFRRLSVADAERKISNVLNCRAGAIEMQDAAIAFDMDKASDYQTIESTFTRSP